MNRVFTLSWFLFKELSRSLAAFAPLGVTVALYWLFFEYPGDVDYFAAAGGFTLIVVSLLTVLLLAGQTNRAATAVIVSRLPSRAELLAAIVITALVVAGLMGLLFTVLVLLQGKVAPTVLALLAILPRWLALATVTAVFALHLSQLVSRGLTYLVAFILLAVIATVVDQQAALRESPLILLAYAVDLLAWPVRTDLTDPVLPLVPGRFLPGLALTMAYSGVLFWLAALLFQDKDLLWME